MLNANFRLLCHLYADETCWNLSSLEADTRCGLKNRTFIRDWHLWKGDSRTRVEWMKNLKCGTSTALALVCPRGPVERGWPTVWLSLVWLYILGLISLTSPVTDGAVPGRICVWARQLSATEAGPEGADSRKLSADSTPSGWSCKSCLEGGSEQGIPMSTVSSKLIPPVQTSPLNSALGCPTPACGCLMDSQTACVHSWAPDLSSETCLSYRLAHLS